VPPPERALLPTPSPDQTIPEQINSPPTNQPPHDEKETQKGEQQQQRRPQNTRKLTFPEYNGNEEPSQWLYKCKKKILTQNKKEEEQMQLAAFHLHGQALTWFIRLE
jgi:hypothetical protein